MQGINIVIIAGNLGADAELRETEKGKVVSFNLAINETFKTREGERKEKRTWVRANLWNKPAEALYPYLKKGKSVHIMGRLVLNEWVDKDTQKRRRQLQVVVRDIKLLGGPGGNREEVPDWEPTEDDIPF